LRHVSTRERVVSRRGPGIRRDCRRGGAGMWIAWRWGNDESVWERFVRRWDRGGAGGMHGRQSGVQADCRSGGGGEDAGTEWVDVDSGEDGYRGGAGDVSG